ncbi:uncharacterized protein LOC111709406 [Eurytemora carolleeae]|uniref:uncharacterized protein LOC111709406 n=1 Tax=Eurytemora carolleeae TaxID=1294199 RepID=UPI000C76A5DF|nr:uncharacterized protein LOC111709406 [Eurytemora carolleeae]|eukprot:XP_023338833.1 uncharacterized protein LOC111709406 [Eurytemora affinis]
MHLTFNMDVKVYNEVQDSTYSPVQVDKQNNCDLNILGIKIGSINGMIQRYANRYVQAKEKFYELRGAKLVAELENKLGVQLGSTVSVKLNNPDGTPRLCPAGRKKRDASCTRKSCPESFTRIGETEMCQKFMGFNVPDCSVFGSNAVLHQRDIGIRDKLIYWCWTPRV